MKIRRRFCVLIGVCAAACLAGICSPLYAQTGESFAASSYQQAEQRVLYQKPLPKWEVFAGPVLTVQPLADGQDMTVTDYAYGAEAGLRAYLLPALALSVGGQYFPSLGKKVPFTTRLKSQNVYAALRCYPLADTLPFIWLEAGGGYMQTSFRLELFAGQDSRLGGAFFFVGTGNSLSLGRGWTLDFSFRWVYMQKTDFDFLYHYVSHQARQAAFFVSKRF